MSIAASEGEPELLERKVRLRCCSGGSNAWVGSGNDSYAFPGRRKGRARVEKATVSRTLEVGWLVSWGSLCWFSAPCPGCLSPGRAWGAYRSWTATFTARNRPAYSASLTTLGGAAKGIRGSPRWSGQLRCKCVLILSPPGEVYVACGDAASTLCCGVTAGSSGTWGTCMGVVMIRKFWKSSIPHLTSRHQRQRLWHSLWVMRCPHLWSRSATSGCVWLT